jgi:hypothetical protein
MEVQKQGMVKRVLVMRQQKKPHETSDYFEFGSIVQINFRE